MSAIPLRMLSAVYTLHSSLELGSLRYSSECEKVPACGPGELALLQRAPASSPVHVCGVVICEFNIHYSTLMIFTVVW